VKKGVQEWKNGMDGASPKGHCDGSSLATLAKEDLAARNGQNKKRMGILNNSGKDWVIV